MKLDPVITEKSLADAKKQHYTFMVPTNSNKYQIKEAVESTFGVKVEDVRTINYKAEIKRTWKGKINKPGGKKAIITLGGKDKIDLFEEK